jgi:transposase
MSLRETLQAIYASPDQLSAQSQLHWLCGWALRSRLGPFRTLTKTVRQHWQGMLAYFQTGLTSAAIEALNGVIQLAMWLQEFRLLPYRGLSADWPTQVRAAHY